MPEKVIHFYPDALVIFRKGFSLSELPNDSDIAIASNLGDIKEIQSIQITHTVRNSPGKFSLQISDTANRFIAPDDPASEIPNLYAYSNRKIKVSGKSFAHGNYYEFKNFKDNDVSTSWSDFTNWILEDVETGERMVVYHRRDSSNRVVERWAFDSSGKMIYVVGNGEYEIEKKLNDFPSGTLLRSTKTNSKSSPTKDYILHKYRNDEFITRYKDHYEQGDGADQLKKGKCIISPMDRVLIFMSRRFTTDGTNVVDQRPRHSMVRVFTGIVNSVQHGYSENNNTLTVEGEDVTKYMRLSVVNISPGLSGNNDVNIAVNISQVPAVTFTTILKNKSVGEIIRLVTLGGVANGSKLQEIGEYVIAGNNDSGDADFNPETGEIIKHTNKKYSRRIGSIRDQFNFNPNGKDTLFEKSSVHIIDPFKPTGIEGFRAYVEVYANQPDLYQNDYKDRREMAYEVAKDSQFEFFADRNGHIWFRPPRFNHGYILGAKNPHVYIIDTESIISSGFVEDDSNLYTAAIVDAEGTFVQQPSQDTIPVRREFHDDLLILKYGLRILKESNPLIRADKNIDNITVYAKSLLQRVLRSRYSGQVTITGRPELDVGMPVFIPMRNMIYYVETVDHSFDFGGKFTTELHLTYGHKPWDYLPEFLTFSMNDEVMLTDGHLLNKSKQGK